MARSPLTLAAAASSALPRIDVVAVGAFTAGGAGRCDSAVVRLGDGRTLVVRAPVDAAASRELAAETLALRALSPGVRELLGVRAPELLGEAGLGDSRALITDLLPGYQVDAPYIPGGAGTATAVGAALAAVHGLPPTVVRAEGLPVRTPGEVREEVAAVIARAEATRRLPRPLSVRWATALASEDLWRFESTVTLGGAAASSFLFQDDDLGPTVTGLLDWHGLAVGDPAIDLRWLASAPDAADDVFEAYTAASHRAPDAHVRTRARLYAELEFARWLVHGAELHRDDLVADAVSLLDALVAGVAGDDLLAGVGDTIDVDDALALLDRVPESVSEVDTSMQTDAYDPGSLTAFLETPDVPLRTEDVSTAPIDISAWADSRTDRDGGTAEQERRRAASE